MADTPDERSEPVELEPDPELLVDQYGRRVVDEHADHEQIMTWGASGEKERQRGEAERKRRRHAPGNSALLYLMLVIILGQFVVISVFGNKVQGFETKLGDFSLRLGNVEGNQLISKDTADKSRAALCQALVDLGDDAELVPACVDPGTARYFNTSKPATSGYTSKGQIANRRLQCKLLRAQGLDDPVCIEFDVPPTTVPGG